MSQPVENPTNPEESPQGDPAPKDAPKPKPHDPLGEPGKKALNAERDARAAAEKLASDLQKQLEAVNQQLADVKNDGLPEWQKKFNDLQKQIDAESAARKQAEEDAAAARTMQMRTDRASATEGFPRSLAKKLTGTTVEEVDAEIAEIMADLGPRSTPGRVPGEGRTVATGSGDPAQQFAELIKNARR